MSYSREGDKKYFIFVVFLSTVLLTSTITLPLFTPTSINDHNIYEKSNAPNSNDSLVNTTLILLVNDTHLLSGESYSVAIGEHLNITVFFRDNNSIPLNGATINITWGGFTYILNEDIIKNQYNFTLDTNDLSQDVNVLTISAQKNNYQSQTIQFFINVQIKSTYIKFYVEGMESNDGDTINSQFDVVLNVIVFYRDNITDSHLVGAAVDLLGLGSFDEIGTQFNYSIQTNNLTKGINILTIFAQLDGYQAQTIQFFINVDERATELILFINSSQVNHGDTVQFEANELINITVFYKDYLTDTHLSGANVELLGVNTLDEINSQFNITINSNDLEQGINILTVFAQLLNYQPKSIQFFIEVIERATQIQLFLNRIDKTADPVLELPIGSVINITVKFYDNRTGLEIPSALLQLIGESLFENLTENSILKQYTIILDSSNLYIGVRLFTIVAQAPNYEMDTIYLRITVNRIRTNISGDSIIEVLAGETIHLEVELTDLDFGGSILNTTVVYTWQFGQGELTDLNSDGIYEVFLNSTMVGVYNLVISAYKGENYDFQSFEIIIIITQSFEIPKFIIPGYNLFTFIGIISIFFIITIQKQLRQNNKRSKTT